MASPAPIAIVGMSCRLPGDVSSPEDLWTLITRGRDGWCPIPADKYSAEAYYHPNPQKRGCFNQKGGYFMKRDLSRFDAPFFQITKQEAIAMDPQQRQLLECTYEALENAGIPKDSVAGRSMGVFVGGASSDFRKGAQRDLNQCPMFDATGNHMSIQAGRISYYFDLRGPSFVADTACSSGLYALHSAVQSLRSGESESAIVAGCALNMSPDDIVSMSMLGLYNEHGKTFAFDHRAKSGYARGEGIGCLVLKPLDQAIRDNDKIRSVIVNTGTGQDGKTVGMTTPSEDAQAHLMRQVYARANISPEQTGFVEAHGTGTKVGDPIEARAIHRVFGAGRTKEAPLYMGSVKTNIGHLENASGIISVIKASMMLEKGLILPNLNFEKPNDAIPLDEWNIKVPTRVLPWPISKRFISINNFGFGGSNAHVVLESGPLPAISEPEPDAQVPRLFVVSGNDEGAAKRMVANLTVYVEQHPEVYQKTTTRDLVYTLGERRTHLPWRIAITATSSVEIAAIANGPMGIPRRTGTAPKLAFVYTGQGAQWPQMGLELMQTHPVFATTMRAAAKSLQRLGASFDLLGELQKSKRESDVGLAHISQPICTAVQLGLTALLSSWGVNPSMAIGHSSGEIVAAYAAGAVSLEDAIAVAYHRGQVAANIKTKYPKLRGAMIAVGAGPAAVKQIIRELGLNNITVACENSPDSVTASGDESAVDSLARELESRSVFNRKLRVDVAYHSSHMELVADAYTAAIRSVTSKQKKKGVNFYSSLLGKRDDGRAFDASYWVQNLTKPVLFSTAFQELYTESKPDIVIEIGPHSALEGPIKQILKGISQQAASEVKYLPCLVRNQHATETMLKLAGSLFTHGQPVDFGAINQSDNGAQKPSLISNFDPYSWSDHKYWNESRTAKQHRLKPFARHDLLGTLEDSYSEAEPTWRNILSLDDVPWLKHHRMQSLMTFPLAGYLCMITEAACQRAKLRGQSANDIAGYRFRVVEVTKALIMDDGQDYEMVSSLRPYAEGTKTYSNDWDEFRVSSWTSARGWLEHCRGLISVRKPSTNPIHGAMEHRDARVRRQATRTDSHHVPLETFYAELEKLGAGYSSVFQMQPDARLEVIGNRYSTGTVTVPDTASMMPSNYETPSILPTAFTDLFFQLTFPTMGAGRGEMPTLYMPSAIKELDINGAMPNQQGEKLQVVVQGLLPDSSAIVPNEFLVDAWSSDRVDPVVSIRGFKMTRLNSDAAESEEPRPLCYKLQWHTLAETKTQDEVSKSRNTPSIDGMNGFTHTNGALVNGHNGVGGHHATSRESSIAGAPIVLVTGRQRSDPLISELIRLIGLESGINPRVSPLATLVPSSSTRYICLAELDEPLLLNMKADTFKRVQNLLLACRSTLWVTAGAYRFPERPENNMAQGLLRNIRSELSKVAASLDLDPSSKLSPPGHAHLILDALVATLAGPRDGSDADCEFAEEDGQLIVPRAVAHDEMNLMLFRETESSPPYLQDFAQPGRRLKVAVGMYGALDSLYWTDEDEVALPKDEIEIKVAATGMNFKDVVIAMGQVASPYLGIECSGTVARVGANVTSLKVGDRVCAMSMGAFGTYARCRATSAALIPTGMSFQVAASVPVVYSTAYYGLIELARMEAGETVLIHAASGGVGQAAIQLAQMVGAEIYATVGSVEKKQLLIHKYSIPEDRIFYSRSTEFGPAVRAATGGRGVDVVINSLAGDLLRETWECLASFGRFIEIGKRDIVSNTRLEMAKFEYNCTFSSVDLTLVATERPKMMHKVLTAVMGLLSMKTIQPIGPISVVGISEVESALRKLQSGKTTGKVIVRHVGVNQQVKATHPKMPTTILTGDWTYVIVGGTGGLGRSITKRMVRRGARHIVLLSRKNTITPETKQLIRECRRQGASVYVHQCDVVDYAQVSSLVAELASMFKLPPIRGVIHAAMVLRDIMFEKMTFKDFDLVVQSKVRGAWNFHNALAGQPLDFFVLMSSISGIIGNIGQAAYSAANTYLDALAGHRRRHGLPAVSLNLSLIRDGGHLMDNIEHMGGVVENFPCLTMTEGEALALVDAAIEGKVNDLCGDHCIIGLKFTKPSALPQCALDARFCSLRAAALANTGDEGDSSDGAVLSLSQQFQRASSAEEAHSIVTAGLRDKLAAILMLPPEVIALQQATATITALGLDSLTAIELRNWIGKELQAHMQVLELLTSGLVADLAGLILRKTRLEGAWVEAK
ncbi:polyketide synthase [Lasiosphaeria hispida]|uniref:Polyketide synthase n=1 Tax=Lasiosphaeria hispida TaxID=260671 RepID=A0AAJ0HAX6_9PEZI|nr:polyketide synthase [Lasiosphaeria hispida]